MTFQPDLSEELYKPKFQPPAKKAAPLVGFITDCTDDFAITKVDLAKHSAFGSEWQYLQTVTIPSFQTDVLGIQGAVLANYLAEYSNENEVPAVLILNSAPRVQGEGLIGGEILVIELDNGLPVLLTNGPGVLEPFANHIASAWKIETDDMVRAGTLQPTQFRSFQWFSDLASKLVYGDLSLTTTELEDITPYIVPRQSNDDFLWLQDSFGNIKLTITDEKINRIGAQTDDQLILNIAGREVTVNLREKLFPLPENAADNYIGLYKGSDKDLDGNYYYELAIAWKSVGDYIRDSAPMLDGKTLRPDFIEGQTIEVIGLVRNETKIDLTDRPLSSNGSDTDSLAKGPFRTGASIGISDTAIEPAGFGSAPEHVIAKNDLIDRSGF